MPTVQLAAYVIVANEKYASGYLPVDTEFGNSTLRSAYSDFFSSPSQTTLEDRQKSVEISPNGASSSRVVKGLVESGKFGEKRRIVNRQNFSPAFTQKPEHANLRPFYYRVSFPSNTATLLILEQVSQFGIKTDISELLIAKLDELDPDHKLTFNINPVYDPSLFQAMIDNSEVKEIEFTRYESSSDTATELHNRGPRSKGVKVSVTISAGRGSLTGRFEDFVKDATGNRATPLIYELRDHTDDYQSTSVRLKTEQGISRKFDIERTEISRAYLDISEDVVWADGTPTFQSVDEAASEWAPEVSRLVRRVHDQ